jgi:hypothetical protein
MIGIIVILVLCFFNHHFRRVATTPDNIPIFLLFSLLAFFLWFSFRRAVLNDRRIAAGQPPIEKQHSDEKVNVWPDLVFIEFIAGIIMITFIIFWAIAVHAPLQQSANAGWAPNPAKAPWYFVGLQETLVYFDPWIAGVLNPSLIIFGLMAIPYLDRNPKGAGYITFNERKIAVTIFLFGFLMWVALIGFGAFLRGPNWTFFAPFEHWSAKKALAENNINLSEIVWVKMLGRPLPGNWFIREIWGFLLLGIYFLVLPPILTRKIPFLKKLLSELGVVRYGIFMFLALMMIAVPTKMIVRWLFNLKYIITISRFYFNI